ncbi:hypothetical protein K435DRAFT_861548 [Dendrothele bispora CBS 962.96]|uniref:Cupredoxin n=1 Tax=Dendrothele bispora (strain CBS 962.96) TaxID=1314807 RepID=A0A4S8LVC8_DENBC|nr:hypothetical protein K435DRAFT_861548 [Dendrothele bispora CBS 962.96]
MAGDIITVNVGNSASLYSPQTVEAALNDTVQFVFSGPLHGVVQASFDNPCVPLAGGFSSGLQGRGQNPGDDTPSPLWNLTITNVSAPIWFYCPASRPQSHCGNGKLVAIQNGMTSFIFASYLRYGGDMFNQFKRAAQATLGNVTASVPPVMNGGQGAFATASPAPTNLSSTSTASTDSSSGSVQSSSAFTSSSPTAVPNPSSNHTAAIAGGATAAGVVVILGALVIFYFLLRRSRRSQAAASRASNYPTSPPHTGTSDTFSIMKQHEPTTPPGQYQTFYGPRHQNSTLSTVPQNFPPEIYSERSPSRPLQPLRPHGSKEQLGYSQNTSIGKGQERRPGTSDDSKTVNSTLASSDANLGMLPPSYNRA